MAPLTEKEKMLRGELYHAFDPQLVRERQICASKVQRFNNAGDVSRRQSVMMWRDIEGDLRPVPPLLSDPVQDDALFENDPIITPPIRLDYGTNIRLGSRTYINFNCVFLDVCPITIGDRALIGPNVSLMAGTHPLDPEIRMGTEGPELGKEIFIGEDCWIGGNAIVLAGVKIGRGAVVGAGSVVTKDVLPFHVVAGNPARVIRKIQTKMDPDSNPEKLESKTTGAELPMAELAEKVEKRR